MKTKGIAVLAGVIVVAVVLVVAVLLMGGQPVNADATSIPTITIYGGEVPLHD